MKVVVLGVSQDGGFPQSGCMQKCCLSIWDSPEKRIFPSCLGICDGETFWIIDMTINFPEQYFRMKKMFPEALFGGIILTHAHVGHYFGLCYLGKEMMYVRGIDIYVMKKMKKFLLSNQPFKEIVGNNKLVEIENEQNFFLSDNISIKPFTVPHREEFSETVGVEIFGKKKSLIFIPDIDSWDKFKNKNILEEIRRVDFAFLDGSFFKNGELKNRDMSKIPHPRVLDCVDTLFSGLSENDKKKIYFIHLNHTNPLLYSNSEEYKYVNKKGFNVSKLFETFEL